MFALLITSALSAHFAIGPECQSIVAMKSVAVAVDSMTNPYQVLLKRNLLWVDAGYMLAQLDGGEESRDNLLNALSRSTIPFRTAGVNGIPVPSDTGGTHAVIRIGSIDCTRTTARARVWLHLNNEGSDRPRDETFYVEYDRLGGELVLTGWKRAMPYN